MRLENESHADGVDACLFCSEEYRRRIFVDHGSVFAVRDGFPVTEGHVLVIPYRHTADYFTLTREEKRDIDRLLGVLRERILGEDPTVTGFNIGVNCGRSAGQTIMHVHVHLIPRRDGDTPEPRGGVRGVIPGKRGY